MTESNGNGYALYNGVKLPNINSVFDASVIPRVAIFEHTSSYISADGRFFFAGYDLFSGGTGFVLVTTQALANELVGLGIVVSEVGRWTTMEGTIPSQGVTTSPVWAGADLIGSYPDYVSTPIPLDGMTVIEWDGNPSGDYLELQTGQYIQRIGDYVSPDVYGSSVAFNKLTSTNLITFSGSPSDSYSAIPSDYVAYGTVDSDGSWLVQYNGPGLSSRVNFLISVKDSYALSSTVTIPSGLWVPVGSYNNSIVLYTPIVAYRTTETPPDEGGGDDDDPQPPAGG